MNFIALCAFATFGGIFAKKLKIPSGYLIGALIFAAFWNIFVQSYSFPYEIKFVSKIVAGVLVGMRIDRSDLKNFAKLVKPLALLMIGLLSYTLILAFLLHKFAKIDAITALFACTPGGLSDITLLSESYGANVPQVVLIQTMRLISIVCLYPPICMAINKRKTTKIAENSEKIEKTEILNKKTEMLSVFVVATVGGVLGCYFGLPAGEMLGSMFATMTFRFSGRKGYMPPKFKTALQISVGVMIGATLTRQAAIGLLEILDVALISVVFVLGFGFVMGFFVHKFCKIDLVTGILGCAPGGVQEMSVIADDLSANISTVTTLQVFRAVTVLSIFPFLIQIILKLAG